MQTLEDLWPEMMIEGGGVDIGEGDDYFEKLDEFMAAVRFRWPNSLVQFEDFSSDKAQFILDR